MGKLNYNLIIRKAGYSHFFTGSNLFPILTAYSWSPSSVHSSLPSDALYAGSDSDGTQIFVGRSFFQGDQLPCKIIPNKNAAYVSYDGGEHFVETYEVKPYRFAYQKPINLYLFY